MSQVHAVVPPSGGLVGFQKQGSRMHEIVLMLKAYSPIGTPRVAATA